MSTSTASSWPNAQRLLEILHALSYRTTDLGDYLKTIADSVSELLQVDWSVVTLCNAETEKILASSLDLQGKLEGAIHGSVTSYVVSSGQILAIEDIQTQPEFGRSSAGYRAYLGVPLRTSQDEVIGTICSLHRQPRKFQANELKIVEMFAERAAIALDNYALYEREHHFHKTLEVEVDLRTQQLHDAQAQLIQKERLAAIGHFSASIVHEIRSPLTTIGGVLRHLQKIGLPELSKERLGLALEETDRLERLMSEILLFARPDNLQLFPVDLESLVGQTVEEFQVSGQQISCTTIGSARPMQADPDKLKQVLINIGRNACEAVHRNDLIAWTIDWSSRMCVEITVNNGGEPIDAKVLTRLTEPFFSTKPTGTGLGLSIVKNIVEAHKGKIAISSNLEAGTTVSIHLPTVSPSEYNQHP
jgi:signal transduction histidine kinase